MKKRVLSFFTCLLSALLLVGALTLTAAAAPRTEAPRKAEALHALHPSDHLHSNLSEVLYDMLSEWVETVARGECASTVFQLELDTLKGLGLQTEWTGADGLAQLDAHTVNTAFWEQFEMEALLDLFRHNHPFELYWHDKTDSGGTSYGCNFSADSASAPTYIAVTSAHVTFHVCADCRPNDYDPHSPTFRTELAQDALAAKAAADALVAEHGHKDLREMLEAYRDAILGAVSYNTETADGMHAYGNPWQMIYVFDGDPETNVVCEGYAKAFQYLCDASGVTAYTVTGMMENENHMWNIVTMEDGKNYLADLTNSDTGMVGEAGGTFLSGADGTVADGYTATADTESIRYTYDAATAALHSESALTLSPEDYTGHFGVGFASTSDSLRFSYDGKPLRAFLRAQASDENPDWLSYGKDALLFFGDGTFDEAASLTYAWYTATDAGERDTLLASDPTDAGKYILSVTRTTDERTFFSPVVTVLPATVSIESITASDRIYDGTDLVRLESVTLCASIPLPEHLSLDLTALSASVDSDDAGEYSTVTLTGEFRFTTEEKNFVLSEERIHHLSKDLCILPAEAPTVPALKLPLTASPFTLDVVGWVTEQLPEDVGDTVVTVSHAEKNGRLNVTEIGLDAAGFLHVSYQNAHGDDTVTLTVTVTSNNYKECFIPVTLTVPCPFAAHSFTSYISDGNATCTADGSEHAVCDGCTATDTRNAVGSMLSHTYADGACTLCGAADPTPPAETEPPEESTANPAPEDTPPAPEEPTDAPSDTDAPPDSQLPFYLLIGGAALLLIIAVVLLVIKRRK